jgi:protein-disulfide isomerase
MSPLTVIVSASDHVAGSLDAPVMLVEYGDFECSHCGRAYPIVHSAQRQLGADLSLVFRHFPMTESHPHAALAAQASESAAAQGQFWPMHDLLFEHQSALELEDLAAYADMLGLDVERFARELENGVYAGKVRHDFRAGIFSGVNGTPTFFVNGARFDGDWEDSRNFIAMRAQVAPGGARH